MNKEPNNNFNQVIFAGPVQYIVQGLSLIWMLICVFMCGCMIIGRTQKLLSCDWLQGFQYNLHEPDSREVSVHKESLIIV